MTNPAPPFDALVRDVLRLLSDRAPREGARLVLGLAGPPAAGKSTLARHLVRAVRDRLGDGVAAYVPLDGFHLSTAQLRRLGRLDRKGAPDTFDVCGYAALLHRLVTETDHDVFVPDYDRTLHEPIAARHVVPARTRLIITEGNYLADDAADWREARRYIHTLWYLDAPDAVRETRLMDRQLAGGKDESAARAWVLRSDRRNGDRVKPTRGRCDRALVAPPLPPAPDA
ncbi:nucleoside/nucleotide kinase family protein [Yinghuangia sp. ASG 101]|uniref:nucleoside/nucleotide kinase family protein n=1 Tax=Yinghuangia sp. ASG 101 TaxID=2896848 RepID=UPI001E3A5C3F|nr:nucleoside/nucleotide kinase family protein [Yinghuangia sp. ASG 101]UGQ13628.1 nucleoside/nucleotide kinase family protein [Yinghuangia sp. ASG 101]